MKTNKNKYFDKVWGISKTAFKKKAVSVKIEKRAVVTASDAAQNNILNG